MEKPKLKTLDEHWKSYFDSCYKGQKISEIQKAEVHQAFFSGILAMMECMMSLTDMPEDEAAERLAEYTTEVENILRSRLMKILPLGIKPNL